MQTVMILTLLACSCAAGFVLSVCFEMPLMSLEKILFGWIDKATKAMKNRKSEQI